MFGKKKKKDAGEDAPEAEDAPAKKTKGGGDAETEGADGDVPVKSRFSKKMLMIAGAGAFVVLLGGGTGAYFFLFSASPAGDAKAAEPALPPTPPQVAYYDVPDMIVNIQTQDGSPAYLKLSVALELDSPAEKAGVQVLMPRVTDQFQGYLRELRLDDLRGSAGVMRVKEELLRRANVAVAPYQVRDVLLKEMIVQ